MALGSRLAGEERGRVSCARVSNEPLKKRVVRNERVSVCRRAMLRCRRRANTAFRRAFSWLSELARAFVDVTRGAETKLAFESYGISQNREFT